MGTYTNREALALNEQMGLQPVNEGVIILSREGKSLRQKINDFMDKYNHKNIANYVNDFITSGGDSEAADAISKYIIGLFNGKVHYTDIAPEQHAYVLPAGDATLYGTKQRYTQHILGIYKNNIYHIDLVYSVGNTYMLFHELTAENCIIPQDVILKTIQLAPKDYDITIKKNNISGSYNSGAIRPNMNLYDKIIDYTNNKYAGKGIEASISSFVGIQSVTFKKKKQK